MLRPFAYFQPKKKNVSKWKMCIRDSIYTGTLGKAFGGALGGFTTGRKEIIDLLRQRSRPYLFSNSLDVYKRQVAKVTDGYPASS